MTSKKQSKLQQITNSPQTTKAVFDRTMFGGIKNTPGIVPKTDDYTYMSVALGDIDYTDNEYPAFLYNSIKNERLVNPVILRYGYTIEEVGGVKIRKKTGRYRIVDGNKRVAIYNQLFNEATAKNNDEEVRKYASVPALILPLNVSDEEVLNIIRTTSENKSVSTKNVIKDITETKNEEITYCYRYEMAEIELEKIVERDNKYKFTTSEIDELEKSIYHAGLMQPIILLPIINSRTMEVEYEIEAGHKRTTAIRQLIQHAKDGKYSNGELVLQAYKTIPSLLIPMGATPEQVEKVYNDTNILSRHMSTDDVFQHISFFDEMPSRPTTKIEYVEFKEKKYRIERLANILQNKFKALGFSDWKNRKAKVFLNIYYYGSDKCLEAFNNLEKYDLTQKDIEWIVTTYKDFNERKKQDEILEKAINDKTYLLQLKEEKVVKRTPQQIKLRKVTENIIKQKSVFDKMVVTPFDLTKASEKDVQNAKKTLLELEKSIKEMKERINSVVIEK